MTRILIFMVVSLFLYTLFIKYHHLSHCPKCHSSKINIEKLIDYTLFTCQICRFSYKDYYSFYILTPISEQFEVDFIYYDEDEDEDNSED